MKYYNLIFLVIYSISSFGQCVQSTTDFLDCSFTAIAHRGYSEFYPENTLVAIEEAFKRGIKYCEIDVAITSDEKYVLHHDPYTIGRTTNGSGTISENSLNDLNLLDAGFWKASYFKETNIPTLVQALNIAEKYGAFLYLDIKDFDAELLANSLAESNADPSRILPAITSMESAQQFRWNCPNSKWVWFGANPENVDNDSWYEEKIELGCKYFEISDDDVFEDTDWFNRFLEKVHEHEAKLWVYTVNNEEIIRSLAEMGVDGVETDRPYVAQLKSCGFEPVSSYPKRETNGNWNFESLDFNNAGVGSLLKNLNTDQGTLQEITFGTCSEMGVLLIDEQEAKVAKIPAYNPANGLFVYDNFMMEDSGAVDYTYSVIMDIYIPSVYKGDYISLIQTSPDNLNDADYFINPEGKLGTVDDYHGDFEFDAWQRVIFVLNGNKVQKYLNGDFIGETELSGSRWTAFNNMAYHGKHGILLFADESFETAEIYVSAIQLRNYAVDYIEAGKLGTPKASGIPVNNANVYTSGIENLEMELIDWEQQIIFIQPKEGSSNDIYNYRLQLSYGASADIPSNGTLNFINGAISIEVQAEDGTIKYWTICRKVPTNSELNIAQSVMDYYPNPFTDIVSFYIKEQSKLSVFDLSGQILYQGELTNGLNQINMKELISGVYLFKVVSDSGTVSSGKLVKSNW